MSNTAYLCCSNLSVIYPSTQAKSFTPERHTVACAVECVPLMWLALFRKADLQRRTIETDDGALTVTAPVTTLEKGLKQLSAAVAHLDVMFAKNGSLATHAALLEKALRKAGGKYVTIEVDEVAALAASRQTFDKQLAAVLDGWSPGSTTESKKLLVKLSHIDAKRPFPTPSDLMSQKKPAEADLANLARLLGSAHIKDVPWEEVPKPKKAAPGEVKRQNELLIDAIAKGNVAKVRAALEGGADPNAKGGRFREPALHLAAEKGNAEIVSMLLEAGATPKSEDPLYDAAGDGHLEIVKLLLQHNVPADSGKSLVAAAKWGHIDIVKLLLKAGANPNYSHETEGHVLDGIGSGELPLTELPWLLKAGADINSSRALVIAAGHGNLDAMRSLIKHGADIEKKTRGMTPLASAGYSGQEAAARFLVEAGASEAGIKGAIKETRNAIETDAKIQYRTPDKAAIQLRARREGVLRYLESLVTMRKAPAPRPEPTRRDIDAIHRAIMKDDTKQVGELLDQFPRIMKNFAWTPMFDLAKKGRVKMMQFLLDRRFDPNERNAHGNTPLHFAAQYKQPKAVSLLLQYGANPKLKDADGDTPVMVAKGECKEILEKHLAKPK